MTASSFELIFPASLSSAITFLIRPISAPPLIARIFMISLPFMMSFVFLGWFARMVLICSIFSSVSLKFFIGTEPSGWTELFASR